MLPVTEEERAVFDEKKEYSIYENMDDASILGYLYDDLLGLLVNGPDNEEDGKILNIIHKRAMRVIEETCKNNEEYDYNRDIDAVILEALQKLNIKFQDELNYSKKIGIQDSIVSDFDFCILMDFEKFYKYIEKKENECESIEKLEELKRNLGGMTRDVHSIVYDALTQLGMMLSRMDLLIPNESNEDHIDELKAVNSEESQLVDGDSSEQIDESFDFSDWIEDSPDDSWEEVDWRN